MPEDDDGYRLWLRYEAVSDEVRRLEYRRALGALLCGAGGDTLHAARRELERDLSGILAQAPELRSAPNGHPALLIGTPACLPALQRLGLDEPLQRLGPEGFVIRSACV